MTRMKPKLVVAWAAVALFLPVLTGCVGRSEYDAKVAELKRQTDKAAVSQQETAQLHKDLDAARGEAEKAGQLQKDAAARQEATELQSQ